MNDLDLYALPPAIDQAVRAAVVEATFPGRMARGKGLATDKELEDGLVHPLISGVPNVNRVILVHEPGQTPVVTVGGKKVEAAAVNWTPGCCQVLDKDGIDMLSGERTGMDLEELRQAQADIASVFGDGEFEDKQDSKDDHGKAPGRPAEPLNNTQTAIASFFSRNDV